MNLKLSFPSGVSDELLESAVFSLPTDIDLSARKKSGHCLVTPDTIYIYSEDKLESSYAIDDIEEFKCEQLIGCSMLCVKTNGRFIALCAFSQKYFLRYVEIVRLLEYYKRYGKLYNDDTADEPSCPKCGLPLNGAVQCPYCAKKSALIVKLIKRMKPYKWMFIASVGSAILLYLISIVAPYLQRLLIDDYIIPKNKYLPGFLGIIGIYMLMNFLRWIFDYINAKTSFEVATSYGRDLRQDLFDKTQKLSMSSISKRTAGELIKRVTNDASLLQDFITQNGKEMILDSMAVIILGIILFTLNFKLAFLVLIPVPIVLFISTKAFNVISIRYGRVWRYNSKASSLLHDILNGIRVVKNFGNEKREIEKYSDISLKWAKSSAHAETIWYLLIPMLWFVIGLGELAVLYFGGELVLGRQIGLGELVQYTTYVAMIYQPLHWMVHIPRALSEASISAGRVFEVLEEQGDVLDHESAVDLDIKGNIRFENVFFGYKAYNPVLKDISCEIKQGEMIGLVGHSGVGKSTFTNLIMRLYDVTGGAIYIDGVDIRDISQQSLRSQVGVVLQETFLFNGTVLDNIRYAKPDASLEEIIKAAKVASCHDFIVRLPDGYNTYVGDKGHTLSGGERQRVSIARAILHDPKILILDEATASLDTQTERTIQDALARLIKGRTTIAIAHRLSTLSGADRLIVLDKGKLAETGTHDQLMRSQGTYFDLVMAQRQTAKLKKSKIADAEPVNA